jgi:hypothetical protein
MKVLETLIVLAFGAVVAISAATYAREVWSSHNVIEQALSVK